MDAVLELKHYSTERLLDLWEMTTATPIATESKKV